MCHHLVVQGFKGYVYIVPPLKIGEPHIVQFFAPHYYLKMGFTTSKFLGYLIFQKLPQPEYQKDSTEKLIQPYFQTIN